MRQKIFILFILLLFLSPFFSFPMSFSQEFQQSNSNYLRKIVLFKKDFTDQTQKDKIISQYGGIKLGDLKLINAQVVLFPNKQKVEALANHPAILLIEDDQIVKALDFDDTYKINSTSRANIFPSQVIPWNILRIKAPQVWKTGNKGQKIKVAVFDTGIDKNHPDLRVKGGVKPRLVNGDPVYFPDWEDYNGHGTEVAGVIAALDNNIGVVGVAPEVELYSVKVLDDNGYGSGGNIIDGLEWAINNKMDVINMSLGWSGYSETAHLVIKWAYQAGIVMVAGSGNEPNKIIYPAGYPEVIAVGATDKDNNVAYFSGRGQELDLVAPGLDIYTTNYKNSNLWKGSSYALTLGTSHSTPHVTGVVALLLNTPVGSYDFNNNGKWDPDEVMKKLKDRARDILDPGFDTTSGYGLVDAYNSILPGAYSSILPLWSFRQGFFDVKEYVMSDVKGINNPQQWTPFTVKGKLNEARQIAQSYANDVKLRAIGAFEGIEIPYDSLDGKVYFANYVFYSPSKDKYVYVWSNAIVGSYIDTSSTPENTLVDLPSSFIDSDVVLDSAEANGGYAFRSEPNTVTGVIYDLRNYPDDDLAPDTVNPYWRVTYVRQDTISNGVGILVIYLNPSDGRLVKKFRIVFKPVTAKERFNDVNSLAVSYASDARFVYVLGIEDTLVDGKCMFWNYGYRSSSVGKFSIWWYADSARIDTFFLDLPGIPLNKPLQFNYYKDSNVLAGVGEANGGAQFRKDHFYVNVYYLYSQSRDTAQIYFHSIYGGYSNSKGVRDSLVLFVHPVTGAFVGSFTKVERDEVAGVPRSFALHQNYPNPFNSMTTISYEIPVRASVKLVIYNVLGQEVVTLVNEVQEPGRYNVRFDASGLSSGVYFYRLEAGDFVSVKKMVLVK